jgi:hypothetical protein
MLFDNDNIKDIVFIRVTLKDKNKNKKYIDFDGKLDSKYINTNYTYSLYGFQNERDETGLTDFKLVIKNLWNFKIKTIKKVGLYKILYIISFNKNFFTNKILFNFLPNNCLFYQIV